MGTITVNDGVTGDIGVSVADGITRYAGISAKRAGSAPIVPPFTNAYFTNDALTNRYFTDDALADPYFTNS